MPWPLLTFTNASAKKKPKGLRVGSVRMHFFFFAVKHGEVGNLLNEKVKLWRLQKQLYLGFFAVGWATLGTGSSWFAASAWWPL